MSNEVLEFKNYRNFREMFNDISKYLDELDPEHVNTMRIHFDYDYAEDITNIYERGEKEKEYHYTASPFPADKIKKSVAKVLATITQQFQDDDNDRECYGYDGGYVDFRCTIDIILYTDKDPIAIHKLMVRNSRDKYRFNIELKDDYDELKAASDPDEYGY